MLAIFAAALLQTSACQSIPHCYDTALTKAHNILTVRYTDLESVQEIETVECATFFLSCQRRGDARALNGTPSWTAAALNHGQGFLVGQDASFSHYYAFGGKNRLTLNRSGLQTGGFSIALTFSVDDIQSSQRLLTLSDNDGQPVYAVDWRQSAAGFYSLWLGRWATTGPGPATLMWDRPWDFDTGAVLYGPRNFHGVSPSPSDIFEIYLTFRPDGKAEVDMFSVSNTSRDFLISHLQDTGLPIAKYPVQPAEGPWAAPIYRDVQTAMIDVNDRGVTPVMQVVYFGQPLTLDERVGFHSQNLFYDISGNKEGTRHLTLGMRPCNSGAFLQLTRDEQVPTPCGPLFGVRSPGTDLPH